MTPTPTAAAPAPATATTAHVVYGLHAFALVAGLVGTATIVGSFIGSIPSILAVILNYATRSRVRGTWIESHYSWQIRTFWFALLWFLVAWGLILTLIGALVGVPLLILLAVWVVYRVARGWMRLLDREPMPAPAS